MVVLLLVFVFIVVPLAELYVIIEVGRAIGPVPTIGILVLDSILGSLLLRSQGRAAWRRFNDALRDRRPPAREVLDGALIIFGGALLLTPGFLTDILGAFLLVPPTRALVRRTLIGWFGRRFLIARVAGGAASTAYGARRARSRQQASQPPTGRPYDVDGDAVDIDPPPLPRSR